MPPLTTTVTNDTASLDVHASLHNSLAAIANRGTGLFGTGEDGSFTLDPAVSGNIGPFSHSGTSADFVLLQDVHLVDLTLTGGARLDTDGFRIHVSGTLRVPLGTAVHCDGQSGLSNSTSGGSAPVAASGAARVFATFGGGAGGGSGGAAGTAGGFTSGVTMITAGAGGASGGGQAGGTAGSVGAVLARAALPRVPISAAPTIWSGAAVTRFGVAGGGGGGGSQANSIGGGGGSGGGYVIVHARTLVLDGTVTAVAGNGAAGQLGTGLGAGGGGGGGGGLVILCYREKTGAGTVSVAGGAGGALAGEGFAGTAGSGGLYIDLPV